MKEFFQLRYRGMIFVNNQEIFEMKMRGFNIDNIALNAECDEALIETRLDHMFPNFNEETDAFLSYIERICLFRGMNRGIKTEDGNEIKIHEGPEVVRQVDYLELSMKVRMIRENRYNVRKQQNGITGKEAGKGDNE